MSQLFVGWGRREWREFASGFLLSLGIAGSVICLTILFYMLMAPKAAAAEAITPEAVAAIRDIEAECDVELRNGAAEIPFIGDFIAIADRLSGFHGQRSRKEAKLEAECVDESLSGISKESEREAERRVDTEIDLCAANQCSSAEWTQKCRDLYARLDSPPPACPDDGDDASGAGDSAMSGGEDDGGVTLNLHGSWQPSQDFHDEGLDAPQGKDPYRNAVYGVAWKPVPSRYVMNVGHCLRDTFPDNRYRCRDGWVVVDPYGRFRWLDGQWMYQPVD